jgi:energy-coupling factor transport system permease protein
MNQDSVQNSEKNMAMIDPRLSLVLIMALIAAVFAATSWIQLILLATVPAFFLVRLDTLKAYWFRLVWLRWFFFFIILLHLVLSPGHTLFGVAWLSYDGLVRGIQVSVQIAIAMGASLVLVRAAHAEQLASAGALLLRPLRMFGVDTDRFVEQILLALRFVPLLREESRAVMSQLPPSDTRLRKIQQFVETMAANLAARADRMAHETVRGNEDPPAVDLLPSLLPLNSAERIVAGTALLVTLLYFGLV